MTAVSHIGVIDQARDGSSYSWFCREIVKGTCTGEGYGYTTREAAEAAVVAFGHDVEAADRDPGRFDGIPGLVWYAAVTKTLGRDLKVGDWLDSLDHSGARMIVGMYLGVVPDDDEDWVPGIDIDPAMRTAIFAGGDGEVIRTDVEYDVVEPDSQVAPDGSPL